MKIITRERTGVRLKTGYEFEDLSSEVQNKVITEHAGFWIKAREYNENNKGKFEKAIDKANKNRTPWFVRSMVADACREEITNEIKLNKKLFNKEGDVLPLMYHTREGKIVKTTYNLHGEKINVKVA